MSLITEPNLTPTEEEELDERYLALIKYKKAQFNGDFESINRRAQTTNEDESEQEEEGQPQEDNNKDQEAKKADDELDIAFLFCNLVDLPKREDVEYDLTCGVCWEYCGPPEYVCGFGHIICTQCFQQSETKTCLTEMNSTGIYNDPNTYVCDTKLIKITDAMKKTAYFQYFLENTTYTCGAWALGCNKLEMKPEEVVKHEFEQCEFRSLRLCQFRGLGCPRTFYRFEDNLYHLIEEHDVPVANSDSVGHFVVPYQRPDFGENEVEKQLEIVPIIRGVVLIGRDLLCILVAKELEKLNKTRMWVSYVGNLNKKMQLEATICMFSTEEDERLGERLATGIELPVIQAVSTIPDVDSTTCYIDMDNEYLDEKMHINSDGQKCVDVMILIKKALKSDQDVEDKAKVSAVGEEEDEEEDEEEGEADTVEEEKEDLSQYV